MPNIVHVTAHAFEAFKVIHLFTFVIANIFSELEGTILPKVLGSVLTNINWAIIFHY